MARIAPRDDASTVPLQGGYVAKQCPVRAQNDTIRPAEPLPPVPFTERLFASGNAFEADVVGEIRAGEEGVWFASLDDDDNAAAR